jgi:hypothetical protein
VSAVNALLNVPLIRKYRDFSASFATVVPEPYGLPLTLFFLGRCGYALGLKRASMPPIFGLAIVVAVSALLLFENVPSALITIIDFVGTL